MLKGITYISAAKKTQPVLISGSSKKETYDRMVKKNTNDIVKIAKIENSIIEENKFIIFFLIGIVLGTLFYNFFCRGEAGRFGIYNEYFSYRFQDFEVNKKDLFLYAFFRYEKEILLLIALAFTSFGMTMVKLFLAYKGSTVGILISVYVQQYGMGGIVLYFLSVFPHIITYVFMIIVLVSLAEEVYRDRKEEKKLLLLKKKAVSYIKAFFILLVLNMITAYLETYINLGVIQKIFM